jgi:hypothetical protein
MKIDLSTVGAALCGRLIEVPTEGLPYIYWLGPVYFLSKLLHFLVSAEKRPLSYNRPIKPPILSWPRKEDGLWNYEMGSKISDSYYFVFLEAFQGLPSTSSLFSP